MIDPATVRKIKETADIVDVVGDYVHLVRRGSNYMGLCPFHNERTPSFSVSKARNFCYCFSCHKGGSPVNFIMEKEGLSYHDALLHLAGKYGIKVEERELSDEEREVRTEREAMLIANEWAMKQMEKNLFETEEGHNIGLQYFYGRGVTEEAAHRFHLGYSIDRGNAMTEEARRAGFDMDLMRKLGVVGMSQDGRLYDRFRGRVMFPVFNTAGKVVAFGGRDLKGAKAKYVNSPESSLYKKSNELYGIFQAKNEIVRRDKCFLVEGYMDVIGMWQSGMENVVASSGTALTDGQIALIHRFTENITLIYDGDAAGIKASLRGIDMLLAHKMKVKVLLLPDGHDPDSFARANTPEQFREYVEAHETDIIRFKARVLMEDVAGDPSRRIDAVRSMVKSLACIPDKIARNIYVQECSLLMGVSEEVIEAEVTRARAQVVAGMRSDRDRRRLEAMDTEAAAQADAGQPQPGTPAQGTTPESPQAPQPQIPQTPQTPQPQGYTAPQHRQKPAPLDELEKNICELALRFGLVDFCEAEPDEDDETALDAGPIMINVAEFIAEELEADNISLRNPVYAKVFDLVLNLRDEFDAAIPGWSERVGGEIEEMRRKGYDEIAEKQLSMEEIQTQERMLEDKLEAHRRRAWEDFVKDFPGLVLASHEDSEIRRTVTDLLRNPYELSKIFFRNNAPVRDEDKLPVLVPRAVMELKDEILNMKMKELMADFRTKAAIATPEEITALQREIAVIMNIRSRLAKDIGERIVSSRGR